MRKIVFPLIAGSLVMGASTASAYEWQVDGAKVVLV